MSNGPTVLFLPTSIALLVDTEALGTPARAGETSVPVTFSGRRDTDPSLENSGGNRSSDRRLPRPGGRPCRHRGGAERKLHRARLVPSRRGRVGVASRFLAP
jgi:hypothetical protein